MEVHTWYLFGLYGLLALLVILSVTRRFMPSIEVFLARRIMYPIAIRRRQNWDSVTRWQILLMVLFFASNAIILCHPFSPVPTLRQVERRSAMLAVTNMVLLTIGKRTIPVADYINIPSTTYHLAHHFVGRMAILEAIIHSSLVFALRPRTGELMWSGLMAMLAVVAILISSVWVLRRFAGDYFLATHNALALTALVGTTWHTFLVSSIPNRVLVMIPGTFWLIAGVVRIVRAFFPRAIAVVMDIQMDSSVAVVTVRTKRPIPAFPGCYFYVSFPGTFPLFSGYPMQPMWYQKGELNSSEGVQNMTFLISRTGKHSSHIEVLQKEQCIRLDGPYGHNVRLDTYEEAILVAKGIGILGILSFAVHLCDRKNQDNRVRGTIRRLLQQQREYQEELGSIPNTKRTTKSSTKKRVKDLESSIRAIDEQVGSLNKIPLFRDISQRIDILWVLEHRSQDQWATTLFKVLEELDLDHRYLVVWFIYPTSNFTPPFKQSDYWKCLYPTSEKVDSVSRIISKVREKNARSTGRMIVVACGEAKFTNEIRTGTIESMEYNKLINFVETEYRPRGSSRAMSRKKGNRLDLESSKGSSDEDE